jgi:small basic protein (TIGR04137 family)
MDRSLKIKGSLSRHRNVLTRAERIKILEEQERFGEGDSPFGLPKIAHRKAPVGGKVKKVPGKEEAAAGEAVETAEAGGEAAAKKAKS